MTPQDVIEALGGGSEIASEIGCHPSAISNWIARNAIPRGRWPDLIEIARRRGVRGITLKTLQHVGSSPGQRGR